MAYNVQQDAQGHWTLLRDGILLGYYQDEAAANAAKAVAEGSTVTPPEPPSAPPDPQAPYGRHADGKPITKAEHDALAPGGTPSGPSYDPNLPPTGGGAGAGGGTYNTKNGSRTLAQMTDELHKANYPGPWDDASVVAAYARTSGGPVSGGGAKAGPGAGGGYDDLLNGAAASNEREYQLRKAANDAQIEEVHHRIAMATSADERAALAMELQRLEFNASHIEQQRQFNAQQYTNLARTLIDATSRMGGPENVDNYLAMMSGGKDVLRAITGRSRPEVEAAAATGKLQPRTLTTLLANLGLTPPELGGFTGNVEQPVGSGPLRTAPGNPPPGTVTPPTGTPPTGPIPDLNAGRNSGALIAQMYELFSKSRGGQPIPPDDPAFNAAVSTRLGLDPRATRQILRYGFDFKRETGQPIDNDTVDSLVKNAMTTGRGPGLMPRHYAGELSQKWDAAVAANGGQPLAFNDPRVVQMYKGLGMGDASAAEAARLAAQDYAQHGAQGHDERVNAIVRGLIEGPSSGAGLGPGMFAAPYGPRDPAYAWRGDGARPPGGLPLLDYDPRNVPGPVIPPMPGEESHPFDPLHPTGPVIPPMPGEESHPFDPRKTVAGVGNAT